MKSHKDTIAGTLFGFACVFLSFVLADSILRIRVYEPMDVIQTLTLIIIAISVFIAYYVHYKSTKRLESEDYLEKSISMLDEAYQLLLDPDDESVPNNDRFAWLSSARLIKRGFVLSGKITEISHKEIYLDTSQYWRWKFHSLLRLHENYLPESFFRGTPWSDAAINRSMTSRTPGLSITARASDALAPSSLIEIYRFIEWPSNIEDPLGDVTPLTEEELHRLETFRSRALGTYLRNPAGI